MDTMKENISVLQKAGEHKLFIIHEMKYLNMAQNFKLSYSMHFFRSSVLESKSSFVRSLAPCLNYLKCKARLRVQK